MERENQSSAIPAVSFDEFAPTSYEQWKEAAEAALKGAPFDKKLLSKTYEGITIQPIYTRQSCEDFGQRLTFPGAKDFLRGTNATGYINQPWTIAQASDAVLPEDANAIIKKELSKGATAVAFGPQLILETLEDAEALFDGIDLSIYPLNAYAGESAFALLALIKAYEDKKGLDSTSLSGCIGADPAGAMAANGKISGSIEQLLEQLSIALQWSLKNAPQLKTIYIQGSVYHNGGANAVQEVAACMSSAIAYIEALLKDGYDINDIAKTIRFGFSLGANFFMEIAKIRASRLIWAQIIKAYGGNDEAAMINITARTSSFTSTVYDPYVNILRSTTQAFSGIVGGVDALQVAPFDEAVRPSDELSRRVARNIQVMMQNEFNLLSPVDPAGGSWYIETLTGQLAEAIWVSMQKIEADGGIFAVLQAGTLQEQIAATLNERFNKLATRADKAVGTNMYANMLEEKLQGTCECEKQQAARKAAAAKHAALYQKSDIDKALANIDKCIGSAVKAIAAGTTVNDIAAKLSGDGLSVKEIPAHRWTEQFEALRSRTEAYKAAKGQSIKVFLANMGPIPQHKARADFSTGFMEVAGFEVLKNDGFASVDEAAAAAKASGADVTIICSTDDTYPEIVPALVAQIKAACPAVRIILAGAPAPELKEAWNKAGIDDYIHVKANSLQILSEIQKARGIC